VPGIGFSPDKMLRTEPVAVRVGIGEDAELVHTYHRDGFMRFDGNDGGAVNYEPNSFGGPVEDPRFKEPPLHISVDADRYNHRDHNDDYAQPDNLFRLMTQAQRQALFANTATAMAGVPEEIVWRWIGHCTKADPAYGDGVAERAALAQKR
jgi:catalase